MQLTAVGVRRNHARGAWRSLIVIAIALLPAVAHPQLPTEELLPMRPVRLEGYWGRTKADPDVLGELTISTDARTVRRFGATAVQAYKPEEEGFQVFRHTALQPIQLTLRGPADMVRRFFDAPADTKIIALGVYRPGSALLELTSVELAGR